MLLYSRVELHSCVRLLTGHLADPNVTPVYTFDALLELLCVANISSLWFGCVELHSSETDGDGYVHMLFQLRALTLTTALTIAYAKICFTYNICIVTIVRTVLRLL